MNDKDLIRLTLDAHVIAVSDYSITLSVDGFRLPLPRGIVERHAVLLEPAPDPEHPQRSWTLALACGLFMVGIVAAGLGLLWILRGVV